MLSTPSRPIVATHWGNYRARMRGRIVGLDPVEGDPDPSAIANGMIDALDDPVRIATPMVRSAFLEHGYQAGGKGRGSDPFVAISWPEAINLVAGEIARVRSSFGNQAIYAGSYGWASAGRFHHAQSQIHRFFNSVGGYTRSVQNYSFAAAATILPHVIGDTRGLGSGHTSWRSITENADTIVAFGGLPQRNSQVNAGGVGKHILASSLQALSGNGARILSISPIRDDMADDVEFEWIPIRPGTDVAMMLGMAHALIAEDRIDHTFIETYTVGFERLRAYICGDADGIARTPEWASAVCGVPADIILDVARAVSATRSMLMMAWSLQRAEHGEQPCWMLIALAAMAGQIGLPGRGFGFGYGAVNGAGNPVLPVTWPSLSQGTNAVEDFIPVARITEMLENPGQHYDYNGQRRVFPDIRMVYWAGGNPFHHHQDLNRLRAAWARPETVIVNESWWNALARHADIVLPVATQLERNDIACAARDRFLAASHKVASPFGEARSDYAIFSDLAERLGAGLQFTEGLDEEGWLRRIYASARSRLAQQGLASPDFDAFWEQGLLEFSEPADHEVLLADFRDDPVRYRLATPSGRIELFSDRVAGFGYSDCPGHPAWLEPREWLGGALARRFPMHLMSSQPARRLHSQYDNGAFSRAAKVNGREAVRLNPADAAARGIEAGDVVRIFNDRGSCLAGAVLFDGLSAGVIQLSTGAWYDPVDPADPATLDKHGNPNVLTQDRGTSRLAQGPSAQSCLVEIERFRGEAPAVTAFVPPRITRRKRSRASE